MDQGTMIVLVIGAVLIIGVGSVVLLGRHAAQSDQTQNAVSTKSGRSSEAETVEDGVTKTKTEKKKLEYQEENF